MDFEWIEGEATISADYVANSPWLHLEIDEDAGWGKVESMVKG